MELEQGHFWSWKKVKLTPWGQKNLEIEWDVFFSWRVVRVKPIAVQRQRNNLTHKLLIDGRAPVGNPSTFDEPLFRDKIFLGTRA